MTLTKSSRHFALLAGATVISMESPATKITTSPGDGGGSSCRPLDH